MSLTAAAAAVLSRLPEHNEHEGDGLWGMGEEGGRAEGGCP